MWLFNRKKKGERIKAKPTARQRMRFADRDEVSTEASDLEKDLQKALWEAMDKMTPEEIKDLKKRI